MYAFLSLSLPLGWLLVSLLYIPREIRVETRRAMTRGFLASPFIWLLARLLGGLVPSPWGSHLMLFHEWADRLLPYAALPLLAYALFYRYDERLPPAFAQRKFCAFYAGAIGPFGITEAARGIGSPNAYLLLVLPFLLASIILLFPLLATAYLEGYGFRRFLLCLGGLAWTLAASLLPWLLLRRFWYFALPLLAGLVALAILPAIARLGPPGAYRFLPPEGEQPAESD